MEPIRYDLYLEEQSRNVNISLGTINVSDA